MSALPEKARPEPVEMPAPGPIQGLDMMLADAHVGRARAALAIGDLDAAQRALKEALETHPGLMSAYHVLGSSLAELGLPKAAERCFRGVMPTAVVEEWFPDSHVVADPPAGIGNDGLEVPGGDLRAPWQDVERHVCHEPVNRSIPSPKGIAAPVDPMFARQGLTSSLAVVDHALGGSLWFDGFNRVVLDRAGQVIERHTRGNPAVVKAARDAATHIHVDGRAFFVGSRGFSNYYHWMLDILPSMQLFEDAGFELGTDDRIVVFSGDSRFQKQTLARLGIGSEQVIEMCRTAPSISADELVVPYFANAMGVQIGRWIPDFLQRRFLDDTPPDLPSMPKIYIGRARDARNGRSIDNEAAMIELLESRGFTTLYPEDHDVIEQAHLLAAADTVLAAHGAGLTNIAFCRPGTRVIELYGNFIAPCYYALSAVCGLDYYNHCCSTTERSVHFGDRSDRDLNALRQRGFAVDLDELGALLDRVDQA